MSLFIENIKKEFFHYKALGDRTIEQLDDKELNGKVVLRVSASVKS